MGGAVAEWLVRWTMNRAIWARALYGGPLCSPPRSQGLYVLGLNTWVNF